MNCESWQQLISLHYDGVLDRKRSRQIQQHLQSCFQCRQFDEFLGKMFTAPAPCQPLPDFWQQVAGHLPNISATSAGTWLAKAAGVLLAIAVCAHLYTGQSRLADQISQLRQEKAALQRQVSFLGQQVRTDSLLARHAFANYDRQNWQAAVSYFQALVARSEQPQTRALALYYCAVIAEQRQDYQSAATAIDRLLAEHPHCSYLFSVRLLMERMLQRAAIDESNDKSLPLQRLLPRVEKSALTNGAMLSY